MLPIIGKVSVIYRNLYSNRQFMFLNKEQKERRVIDLYYNQGKTTREIVEELRVSPNYVSAVLKKHEEEENAAVSKIKHEQLENKTSKEVAAIKLFSEGKDPIEVVIKLKLSQEEVTQFYNGYLKLKGLYKFVIISEEHKGHIPYLLKLCSEAEKEGISTGQLVKLAKLVDENILLDYQNLKNNVNGF
jgi:IS30 family transposase